MRTTARRRRQLLAALGFLMIAAGVYELCRELSTWRLMQASPPRPWMVRQF